MSTLRERQGVTGMPALLISRAAAFVQEEFLRRLSHSQYRDNLILKGGLFLYTLTNFDSRPTQDIDFLMKQLSNDLANVNGTMENAGKGFHLTDSFQGAPTSDGDSTLSGDPLPDFHGPVCHNSCQ